MSATRVAYLVSHPIQYQAPLLRRIANEPDIDLTVFFCSDYSLHPHYDPGFHRTIEWDVPLTEGYEHSFLPALGDRRRVSLWRPFNYGIARALKAGRFDAMWVHGYARPVHLMAMMQARRLGIPVLIRDEATAISAPRGVSRRIVKRLFFAGLRRLCAGALAIGTLNRRYYLDHGFAPERVFDMPYAVDNAYFRERAIAAEDCRTRLRAELKIEQDRPVILFVGKLTARKNPSHLLEAYARLVAASDGAPPYLLIAGDGPDASRLKVKAHALGLRDARFLGFRPQAELPRLYGLCDVFVIASVHEPWGLVVNEVMAVGRAVVASDQVGAAADLVRDGENGFVYPAGDIAALADALRRVLDAPETWRRMGARSRALIEGWSFDQDIAGLKSALAALCGERRRGG
jgi:glycosyltransferase involved in cell wall biosynthesis